jgi:integrase
MPCAGKLRLVLHLWKNPRDGYFYLRDGQRRRSLNTQDPDRAELLFNAASSLSLEDQVATLGGKVRKPLERFRDEYLASRKGYSPDTLRADRMAFDRAIAFFGKDRLLHTIRPDHVQDLRVDLLRGVAEGSVKTWFGHLSAAFSLAAELGYLRKNPFPKRRRRPYGTMHESAKEPETPRYITPEILEEIITGAADEDFGRILRVYWMTGMRRRELVRMKWEQVGTDDLKIIGKGRKHRTFPLSPEILALLGARGKPKEYVFPLWRDANTITRRFRVAAIAAGFPDVSPHKLRHSFATRLAMAGLGEDVRMPLMGHSTKEMSRHYTHVTQEHLRTALEGK